jgi:hypothetical protein
LIPPNPHTKREGVLDKEWEDSYLDKLRGDIEKKLSSEGFDVAYRKHKPINISRRLYAVDFVVSILHPFGKIEIARAKGPNFRIKAGPFSKAKNVIGGKIADALKMDYVINAIAYEYAAYRTFIFEDHLLATLRIRHILTPDEIDMADGKIINAIEFFENEIIDSLGNSGWSGWMKATAKRPKDNIYEFELAMEALNSYSETEVCGSLVLLTKDMSASEAGTLGIDTIDPSDNTAVREEEFRSFVDQELLGHDIVEASVQWMDYDPDVYEIINELEI